MFDTEIFIDEVQHRDVLWNLNHRDYANRNVRVKLWKEVAAAVYHDWEDIQNPIKNERVKELQKKWKSIRDAFTREVRLQRSASETGARKRKRYVYFDQLLFLFDTLEERETSGNINEQQVEEGEWEQEEPEETGILEDEIVSSETPQQQQQNTSKKRQSSSSYGNHHKRTFEEQVIHHFLDRASEDDCDRMFLLSFLPMFHKMSDQTKLWARLKITEVMQQAMGFHSSWVPHQQRSHPQPPDQLEN